ncbi:DUF3488 and transglutaminase-like domain-containing protein [Desulfobacterales bacterium HSG16]|nr:DUF3488 and transglutaminase-like domain-containing protein [Desulfobacterales bacterium HSG16]
MKSRTDKKNNSQIYTRVSLLPILLVMAAAITPHMFRLPSWIFLWCLTGWIYSYFSPVKKSAKVFKIFISLAAVCGLMGVLLTFGRTLDRDASLGLLAVMAGLKPVEVENHRDRTVTLFLAYFLVITCLLYDTTALMTLYMFVSVFLTTSALVYINHPLKNPAGTVSGSSSRILLIKDTEFFRMSGTIMMQAIPLMVLLFFLFPRIHGSLWGSASKHSAKSGFSSILSPGGVSRIVRSDETAFRVQFTGDIPPNEQLYWRGIVFWQFNANSWRRGIRPGLPNISINCENPVEYEVVLEPHHQKWLFVLDLPVFPSSYGFILKDHTLYSGRRIRNRIQYRIKSCLAYNTGPLEFPEQTGLDLPKLGNPEARKLAEKWASESTNSWQVVLKALEHFRYENFYYTLTPERLYANPVDEFLFETQEGFCEHYASAFAFLMRAAGVPCRIVGGYQGGEKNPYANYLRVRQADAHVWNEVWIREKGWVRVDPTAAVAPERIEKGIQGALAPEELPDYLTDFDMGMLTQYLKKFGFRMDAVNTFWNSKIIAYSFHSRRALLSRLGIDSPALTGIAGPILVCIGCAFFICVLLYAWYFRKSFTKKDRVQALYLRFCKKLARIGIVRKPSQGPLDYAKMAGSLRKDLKNSIDLITDIYIKLRYSSKAGKKDFLDFSREVKKFKP